ncbi:MAG: CidA/LrgA family protein [Betaproteobacteria bacterium]|nr:CidA/LrgA family protein [Betaproteobacteria bacterium]
MLRGLALLLVFQSLGEVAVRATGTVVPGPVVGMVLLFVFLVARKNPPESLVQAADGLLSHLAIFYIPAAVGVMLYAKPLAEQGLAWFAAIVVSTLGAMLLPALLLKRWLGNQPDTPRGESATSSEGTRR